MPPLDAVKGLEKYRDFILSEWKVFRETAEELWDLGNLCDNRYRNDLYQRASRLRLFKRKEWADAYELFDLLTSSWPATITNLSRANHQVTPEMLREFLKQFDELERLLDEIEGKQNVDGGIGE